MINFDAMPDKESKTDSPKTEWFRELEERYYAGINNFFILSGNIGDYPVPGLSLKQYLTDKFKKDMKMKKITNYGIKSLNRRTASGTRMLDSICNSIRNGESNKEVIVINYPELLFPNETDSHAVNLSRESDTINFYEAVSSENFAKSDNIIVLITESHFSLNEKLLSINSRSYPIEISFPDMSARYKFINFLEETSGVDIDYEISKKDFARLSAGLTLVGLEDIYLQAEFKGVLKRDFIMERKKELIQKEYGDVLEVLDSDGFTFNDFAGQDHLKKYHREVIVDPMLSGDIDIVPKGLLYVGPPGTGKTHFARCLAGESGINFVELKMSQLRDKWVGESEKKFDKALSCIKSIMPVGVFIDEIDQSFSRGEGDNNPVRSNMFSMFLTILSEPKYRGKIIWIGAANYPNTMDEALKRTGRLDKKIPFLAPNEKDRAEVLKVHLEKAKLENNLKKDDYRLLSEHTKGYTQAELEAAVVKALELAIRGKRDLVVLDDLLNAIELVIPATSEKINKMEEIAIEECNDLEFLPKDYREMLHKKP